MEKYRIKTKQEFLDTGWEYINDYWFKENEISFTKSMEKFHGDILSDKIIRNILDVGSSAYKGWTITKDMIIFVEETIQETFKQY